MPRIRRIENQTEELPPELADLSRWEVGTSQMTRFGLLCKSKGTGVTPRAVMIDEIIGGINSSMPTNRRQCFVLTNRHGSEHVVCLGGITEQKYQDSWYFLIHARPARIDGDHIMTHACSADRSDIGYYLVSYSPRGGTKKHKKRGGATRKGRCKTSHINRESGDTIQSTCWHILVMNLSMRTMFNNNLVEY